MSDHFDGRRFFNPTGTALQPFSEVPRMLREPRMPLDLDFQALDFDESIRVEGNRPASR